MTNVVPVILGLLIVGGVLFATAVNTNPTATLPSPTPTVSPTTSQPSTTPTPFLKKIKEIFVSPKPTPGTNTCETTVTCVSPTTGESYEVCADEDEVDPCGEQHYIGPPQTCRFCMLADCQEGYQCVCTNEEQGSCQPYEGQGIGHN